MANLVYVKSLKWTKKCSGCGDNIPQGMPCWWNGEKGPGSKSYHENHKPQTLDANSGSGRPSQVANKAVGSGPVTPSPSFDIMENIKKSKLEVEKEWGASFLESKEGWDMVLLVASQKFALYMSDKIQKQKEANMQPFR